MVWYPDLFKNFPVCCDPHSPCVGCGAHLKSLGAVCRPSRSPENLGRILSVGLRPTSRQLPLSPQPPMSVSPLLPPSETHRDLAARHLPG